MGTVPSPAQMHDVGQYRLRQASLMMDELAGHHRDERNSDEVSGLSRQTANQVVGC